MSSAIAANTAMPVKLRFEVLLRRTPDPPFFPEPATEVFVVEARMRSVPRGA